MTLAVGGFGLLLGSPIAGGILESQSSAGKQEYPGLLAFSGVWVFVGGLLQIVTRVLKVGFSLHKA